MIDFLKRTWAQIDLDAIRNNYKAIAQSLSYGCRAMAIVKADAYGHGAGFVSRTLRDAGVTWFGVSNLDEALQIRDEGISESILILAYTPPEHILQLAENNITQTVFEREYAQQISKAAVEAGVTVGVHIKVDTGMSRIGFFCQSENGIIKTIDEIEQVCALPGLYAEGIFTHFASADEEQDDGCTQRQFERFLKVIEGLSGRGIHFSIRQQCRDNALSRNAHGYGKARLDSLWLISCPVAAGNAVSDARDGAEDGGFNDKNHTGRHSGKLRKDVSICW
jgi:alanine racemase